MRVSVFQRATPTKNVQSTYVLFLYRTLSLLFSLALSLVEISLEHHYSILGLLLKILVRISFSFYCAIHSADYAVARCLSACLSVCPSVTRRYSVETFTHILKLFLTVE